MTASGQIKSVFGWTVAAVVALKEQLESDYLHVSSEKDKSQKNVTCYNFSLSTRAWVQSTFYLQPFYSDSYQSYSCPEEVFCPKPAPRSSSLVSLLISEHSNDFERRGFWRLADSFTLFLTDEHRGHAADRAAPRPDHLQSLVLVQLQ